MRPSIALNSHPGVREEIRALLNGHGLTNPRIFGSTSIGSDTESSDLDILVSKGNLKLGLLKMVRIEREISELLGVPVHIVTEETVSGPRWAKIVKDSKLL